MRVLKRPAVQAKTGLSKTHIYLLMSQGKFPKPIRLGVKSCGWVESELDQFIQDRIRERDRGKYE